MHLVNVTRMARLAGLRAMSAAPWRAAQLGTVAVRNVHSTAKIVHDEALGSRWQRETPLWNYAANEGSKASMNHRAYYVNLVALVLIGDLFYNMTDI